MACGATLKRSLDLDPLHSPSARSPKRRRCIPMNLNSPAKQQQPQSPFKDVTPKLSSEQIAQNIAVELKRMQRRRQLQMPGGQGTSSQTVYPQSPSPPLGQLLETETTQTLPGGLCSETTQALPGGAGPSSSSVFFNALSPSKKDLPLFTFRQVSMVCERMLKEREEHIRSHYDRVLTCKLAEQYEAFLKFNHDQIQRMYGETPASYVS